MFAQFPRDKEYTKALLNHFSSHFGGQPQILNLPIHVSTFIDTSDMFFIKPTADRNYFVVFTCGMGTRPMRIGDPRQQYAELCFFLPITVNIAELNENDETWMHIFGRLKILSQYPFAVQTFFADGHSIPGDETPPGVDFSADFISEISTHQKLSPFQYRGKRVNIYGLIQLYKEELDVKLQQGGGTLMQKFQTHSINPYIYDPQRKNVVSGRVIENTLTEDTLEEILDRYDASPTTLEQWHELADRISNKNELANTQNVLFKITKLFPKHYLAYYKLALSHIAGSRLPNTPPSASIIIPYLKIVTNFKPEFVPAWETFGFHYLELSKFQDAINSFIKCTELEPKNSEHWKNLSLAYEKIGNDLKSAEAMEKAQNIISGSSNPKEEEPQQDEREQEQDVKMDTATEVNLEEIEESMYQLILILKSGTNESRVAEYCKKGVTALIKTQYEKSSELSIIVSLVIEYCRLSAGVLLEKEQLDAGLECIRYGKQVAEKYGYLMAIMQALNVEAIILSKMNQNDKSLQIAHLAQDMARENKKEFFIENTNVTIRNITTDKDKLQEIFAQLERNQKKFSDSVYNIMAYKARDKTRKALSLTQDSLKKWHKTEFPQFFKAAVYELAGKFSYDLGKHQQGLEYYTKSYEIHFQLGNIVELARTMGFKSLGYKQLNNSKKYSFCLHEICRLWREAGDLEQYAMSLYMVAMDYVKSGNRWKGLEVLKKMLPIAEKHLSMENRRVLDVVRMQIRSLEG